MNYILCGKSLFKFWGRIAGMRGDRIWRCCTGFLMLGLVLAIGQAVASTQIQWPVKDSAFVGSWPSDSEWTPLHALDDPANDVSPTDNVWNFVGDSNNPGFYIARKTVSGIDYLFFRIRVNWSGTVAEPACTSINTPPTAPSGCDTIRPFGGTPGSGQGAGSLFIFVQSGLGESTVAPQYAFAWDFKENVYAHGMEMTKRASGGGTGTWGGGTGVTMDDVDGLIAAKGAPDFDNSARPGVGSTLPYFGKDAYIRTVDGIACVGTDCSGSDPTKVRTATTFVDFAISCNYLSYLTSSGGVGVNLQCGQSWYFQMASLDNVNDHGKPNVDVAGGASLTTVVDGSLKGPVATYALISDFNARTQGNQVQVAWDTQSELGTQGFELARLDAEGVFQPLHEGLITGQNPAGEGGSYRFLDPTAAPGVHATYRLTEVESNGNRREIGQFPVTPFAPPASARATPVDQPARSLAPGQFEFTPRPLTRAEHDRLQARRVERADADHWGQRGLGLGVVNSAGPPANRAAIAVRKTGLYQVSTSALALALDWPEGKVKGLLQAGQLRLTNQGADVAWQAAAKGEGLRFYGEASRSIYDPENVYVVQQGAGTRMTETRLLAKGTPGADSFPSRVGAEENRFASTFMSKDPEEDFWFWSSFMNGGAACGTGNQYLGCGSRTFSLAAPEATGSGAARLRLWLRGITALPPNPDHLVRVSVNGTPVGDGQWDGLSDYILELPLEGSLLRMDGQNQVQVQAQVTAGVAYNSFNLDRLELDYQRHYQADQDALTATGGAGQLLVARGFTSAAIQAYDLTNPRMPRLVIGTRIEAGVEGYQVSLVPASAATPYLLVTEGSVRAPAGVRPMETTGLAGAKAGAPYLVIAPRDFYDEASQPVQRLLNLRSNQGLSGRFVPLQAIYDEYGDGQKTPHAIRRFLAEAVATWKEPPAYVLLAGKGTFDPKDYLGYGTDRLPVLLALTPDAGLIATDQRFVDVDGDGLGDLAIGRLPATTAAEFAGMVDKLVAYEDAGPATVPNAILLADGPDSAGNHTANSEAVATQLLAAGLQDSAILRLYLEKVNATSARTALLAGLQNGVGLLNYFGHAGFNALDHNLLTVSDAMVHTDHGQLPVMLGMTCLVNRFEFPQLISLGEALLLNSAGGAVAVWSSGGYSIDIKASALNNAALEALLQQRVPRLGDAIQAALGGTAQSLGPTAAAGVYNLLGDPATSNVLF